MVSDSIEPFLSRRIFAFVLLSLFSGSPAARCQTIAAPSPAPLVGTPTIGTPTVGTPTLPAGNPFESEVTALEAKLSQSPISSSPIVFYGSSSIRLWKSLQQDFSGYAVLNCGFGGSRLTDCVRYASRLVLRRKPSAIVIYAGDHDLASGAPPEAGLQCFS